MPFPLFAHFPPKKKSHGSTKPQFCSSRANKDGVSFLPSLA